MPFNGAGVFTRVYNWVTDAANGIMVRADRMDGETDGIATGLSNCVTRDGQSPATADLPMGGFKLTGLSAGGAANDSVRYAQISPLATFLLTPSSANLAAAVTDETGTAGSLVFSASPTLTGTVTLPATSTFNATGLGIGVSPSEILHARKDQNAFTRVLVENYTSGTAAQAQFRAGYSGTQFAQLSQFSPTFTTSGVLVANSAAVVSVGNTAGLSVSTNDAAPLVLGTNNTANLTIASGGNATFTAKVVSTGATSGIGYATGAGGSIVQITSKATGVTLNNICGGVSTHNAALAAGAVVSFVVTNSACEGFDTPVVCVRGGGTANAYRADVTAVVAGSFTITLMNITAGSLSEVVNISFTIIKSVQS